jgi:cytochrome c-type biogenesis protein
VSEFLIDLYMRINEMARSISQPVYTLATGMNVAGVTALLLGMVGATAPCQFTSNSSAIALVTKHISKRLAWVQTGYFVLGKSFVYMGLGILTILFGITIQDIPLLGGFLLQKLMGPVLVLIGFILLGFIPMRINLLDRLREKVNQSLHYKSSAFSLGITMGFLFCPTLFWLFFGLVIPKGSVHWTRMVDPLLFSIGTAIPLILYTSLMSIGTKFASSFLFKTFQIHKALKWLSGGLFVLTGMYETIGYWLI